jgi:long-chain acyl-CoA synthetase
MKPTRLFDCIAYQLEHNPKEDMLAAKIDGIWKKYSTAEVKKTVDLLSAGLLSLHIGSNDKTNEGRDKIAILSNNRPEWLMLDMAVQQIGAVLTPIYPTISVHELAFVLNDAAVKLIFVSDKLLFEKVQSIRHQCPTLKAIFTFDDVQESLHWKEILTKGTEADKERLGIIKESIGYEDLATIIYTSGTTGTPKGVMLSHQNILSNVLNVEEVFYPVVTSKNEKALSFLPLNHIFERMVSYIYLFHGCSIYYAESMDTIGDNLKEVKPIVFSTVPRLLEKVYDKIIAKGQELTGIKRKLFFWAVELGNRFELEQDQGLWYNLQLAIANKLVFSKWREALGGNINAIVTGAAACQVRLVRIFTAAKIIIMEGYGLTETSPVVTVNRYEAKGRKFGTVGPVIKGVEVRLAEDGEICCRGENIMMGYYKQPELTADVIDQEGWFHTGDIGVWENNTFLKITDRKKEIFKTSGGKYVAPQPIENKMKESSFIEQMMVVGSEQKFAGALIVPNMYNLQQWYHNQPNALPLNEENLVRDPKVIELYKNIVQEYNQFFNHVEQIKKFELLTAEWTIDGGELTPTLKLKRKIIMEKYKEAIDRIYC